MSNIDYRIYFVCNLVIEDCTKARKLIRKQYSDEYQIYLAHVEEEKRIEADKKVQEDIVRKQLEGAKLREEVARYHDQKERHLAEARDRELG